MKILTDNDGDVIFFNVDRIKRISRIEERTDKVMFGVDWLDGTANTFSFNYNDYNMKKELLINKVRKIREDIVKDLNGGKTPELMFPEINLIKDKNLEDSPIGTIDLNDGE